MSWRDRLLMKMMGNKVVIRIMSIPIVMTILTKETQAFMWVISLFSRKKKETQPDQSQPSDSGNVTPS
jgi:hypothetical protein